MIRTLSLVLLATFASWTSVATAAYSAEPADVKATEQKRLPAAEWCFKDDLPKSVCVSCDKKVVLQLRKDKDYCKEHNNSESFCVLCDPQAQAKIDALRPDPKEWPADWKPKATPAK